MHPVGYYYTNISRYTVHKTLNNGLSLHTCCVRVIQLGSIYIYIIIYLYIYFGFSGLGVACWPLVPKLAGSNPAEAVGFVRAKKNPQHAFLRRGSKAVGPMSLICGM